MNTAKRTHVETYTNTRTMQYEVEQAAKHGWEIQSSTGIGGKGSAGKALGGALLGSVVGLGIPGLIVGGMQRGKDKITVTFVRSVQPQQPTYTPYPQQPQPMPYPPQQQPGPMMNVQNVPYLLGMLSPHERAQFEGEMQQVVDRWLAMKTR